MSPVFLRRNAYVTIPTSIIVIFTFVLPDIFQFYFCELLENIL